MKAYLHFGTGDEPRLTMAAEVKSNPLWWQKQGLQFTASGYGKRIPTEYMVKTEFGRWRRVYCCIFSNIGTLYIGDANNWEATVSIVK